MTGIPAPASSFQIGASRGLPIASSGRLARAALWCVRKTRQGPLIGIDCPNEDHDPVVRFDVGRMRWRPAEQLNAYEPRERG
jgi:hypothetical protein